MNVAPVPLNRTALTLVNPVPLIVTAVPALPLVGEKLEIVSPLVPVTVKLMLLVPVPAGVVTETCPVVAPLGTVVWMFPVFTIVNEATGGAVEPHRGRTAEEVAVDVNRGAHGSAVGAEVEHLWERAGRRRRDVEARAAGVASTAAWPRRSVRPWRPMARSR